MNALSDFYLNKVRCEVAMQQALQEWQPKPKTYGMECPRCHSTLVVKKGQRGGVQKYLCNDCYRSFKQRPLLECDCLIPGQQLKCQNCPQFKEFLGIVKQKTDSLRLLNE